MVRRLPSVSATLGAWLLALAAACTSEGGASATSEPAPSGAGELAGLEPGSTILVMNRHDPSVYLPYQVTRVVGKVVHYRHDETTEAGYESDLITRAGLSGAAKVGDDVLCKVSEGWRRCRVVAVTDGQRYQVLEESGRRDRTLGAKELALPTKDGRSAHKKALDRTERAAPGGSAAPLGEPEPSP